MSKKSKKGQKAPAPKQEVVLTKAEELQKFLDHEPMWAHVQTAKQAFLQINKGANQIETYNTFKAGGLEKAREFCRKNAQIVALVFDASKVRASSFRKALIK